MQSINYGNSQNKQLVLQVIYDTSEPEMTSEIMQTLYG